MPDFIVRKRITLEREFLVKNARNIADADERFDPKTDYQFPHENIISEEITKIFREDYL